MRRLKDRARRNGRSMEQEARCILSEAVPDRQEAMRRIEALWPRLKRSPNAGEVEQWVREARRWRGR